MILAINDCVDDYPDTDEDHGMEEHVIDSTNDIDTLVSQATITDEPCDPGPDPNSNEELYEEDMIMLDTSMDLDIKEIELIDLVDDSDDESDQKPSSVYGVGSTDDEETDTDDVMILGNKSINKIMEKRKELEVIDLLSSSEESEEDVSACF
jgi:hypothetical protein